eukprot:TRINITY_DN1744_c0_g1_i1.p1 TRINITY_DN1744_c0_g1~~TRINITY_DN1744_c0_g1_i1.p1  ORF type:complete len:325 (-),score=53.31 TRINITY_DN1744_c0_g1_i1:46-1020(-)
MVVDRATFTYYEAAVFAPVVYGVLGLIAIIFLAKACRNYILCSPKHKLKHRRMVTVFTFTVIFIISDMLSLVLYNWPDPNSLIIVSVFASISIVCFFTKFLFMIAIWMELVLSQYSSIHSNILYVRRKLVFILCSVWLALGVIFSGITSFRTDDLQYVGTVVFVFNALCVAVIFTIVAVLLYRLMKNLQNNEKGKTFRRRLTIVASLFILFLYLYMGFYFVYLDTRNYSDIPIEATIFFQNVPEFGSIIVVLWFMNPFHLRRPGSKSGIDSSSSGNSNNNNNNGITCPNNSKRDSMGSGATKTNEPISLEVTVSVSEGDEDIPL